MPVGFFRSLDEHIPEPLEGRSDWTLRSSKSEAGQGRCRYIDVYFVGDSITRRWGATDYPELLAHWRQNFFGWNAGNFGWGADRTENILWRLEHGELDGVNPKVIVIQAGTDNMDVMPEIDQVNANLARLANGRTVRYLSVNDKLADKDGRLFQA